jgi:hypothetical protein
MLAAALPSSAGMDEKSPFERALTEESAWVIRAQSPTAAGPLVGPPQGVTTYYPSNTPVVPVQTYNGAVDPFASPAQPMYPSPIQDPWSAGGGAPYAMPAPYYSRGINGPQPVQYGWASALDLTFLPQSGTSPNAGDMSIFGVDVETIHTKPWGNWTFAAGPQFSYRSWNGPTHGTPTIDLPGSVYRIGFDMVLRTPTVNGWTAEFGFDPSVASDFNSGLNRDGVLFDGHIVAFWQASPQWTWALGAFYWDRVDNIVLPYAGAIWTPNDIWEFRLVFPKPRISVFLGTPWGIPSWLYAGIEYHVEAYQVDPALFGNDTRVQLADWRFLGGLRAETGRLTSFIEAGYIFDRKVKYDTIGTDFTIDNGFIGRVGFRF